MGPRIRNRRLHRFFIHRRTDIHNTHFFINSEAGEAEAAAEHVENGKHTHHISIHEEKVEKEKKNHVLSRSSDCRFGLQANFRRRPFSL